MPIQARITFPTGDPVDMLLDEVPVDGSRIRIDGQAYMVLTVTRDTCEAEIPHIEPTRFVERIVVAVTPAGP